MKDMGCIEACGSRAAQDCTLYETFTPDEGTDPPPGCLHAHPSRSCPPSAEETEEWGGAGSPRCWAQEGGRNFRCIPNGPNPLAHRTCGLLPAIGRRGPGRATCNVPKPETVRRTTMRRKHGRIGLVTCLLYGLSATGRMYVH